MRFYKDVFGRKIRLTQERLNHINDGHPEIARQFVKVRETLLFPDIIISSNTDDDVQLFYRYFKKTPVGGKYLCVVVKEIEKDYFILTIYFTDSLKGGTILWQITKN